MLLFVLKAIEDQQVLNNLYGSPEDVKTLGHVLRHVTVLSPLMLRLLWTLSMCHPYPSA